MTINCWTPEPNIVLHQALGKVAEEAAELAKIATRCMIQGFHEDEPVSHKPNWQALREEVADLKAATRWLFEIVDEPYQGESQRERRKFDGFREWQAMLEAEAAERPFREDDIRRGLILFRTSNSAHGFTNCISVPAKLDELPQEARDEIAITMHNMAASLAPALEQMNEGRRTTMTIKVDASAAIAAIDTKLAEIADQADGWRPIAEADKDIAYIHDLGPDMRIGNSYPIWVKDDDGRIYEAHWSDNGKRAYWWDIEGESPVDPVAFMPHPLALQIAAGKPTEEKGE